MFRSRFRLRTVVAVISSVLLAGCALPDPNRQMITIKGSDTMVLLGQRWAEVFMASNPGRVIQVTGGGSGTGIAALINGTTQICQASRPMKEEEKGWVLEERGAEPVEIPVALDAIAVYVHVTNPVQSLSLTQLSGIYRGETTNWRDVGGPDAAIVLYGRENNSGTYVYFKERVMGNADFAPRYQALPGTAAVINAVTQDPLGIGYGGIGYSTDVKSLPIASENGVAVAPSMENVLNNSYPISRELYWYTVGAPSGALKQFVDWVLGPEGQSIVAEVGYYPLRPTP